MTYPCSLGHKKVTTRYPTLLLLLLTVFAAGNSYAATLTVTKTEDTNDNLCDADCSLREAVFAAVAGDTVAFSPLFSTAPQLITLAHGQIFIDRDLSIQGPGAALLDISGANLNRIFNISGGAKVAISGLAISNGRQVDLDGFYGGGILLESSTLDLTNVVLRNNFVRTTKPPTDYGEGGAIYSHQSDLKLTNCEVYNNTADLGGIVRTSLGGTLRVTGSSLHNNNGRAVSGVDGANITVVSSTFTANSHGGVGAGGTIFVSDSVIEGSADAGISSTSALTVDRCIIRNNINTGGVFRLGGGIYAGGLSVVRSSAIYGNRASYSGGGISNGGTMYIENTSITNNSSVQFGGGVDHVANYLYLTNSTVSGNRSSKGGGIYNQFFKNTAPNEVILTNTTVGFNVATMGKGGGLLNDPLATASIANSIFSNNTSSQNEPDVSGTVVSAGFNLVVNPTGSLGWISTDLLSQDAQLGPLGSNGGATFTHALLPGSPAINAGSNALAVDPQTGLPLATDQRGTPRILGGPKATVDIGSYEANYGVAPVDLVGRILTASGRPLRNTRVTLSDGLGEPRYAVTNHSGYYRFLNLTVAQTYTITATDKLYIFAAPLVVTADQDRDDLLLFGSF